MILAFIEADGASIPKSARSVIRAALDAKANHGYDKVVGVLLGDTEIASAAKDAAQYGLDEILYVQSGDLKQYLALPYAEVLIEVCQAQGAKLLIGAANTTGKDLFPRIAARLDAAQASDVIEFLPGGQFQRPMYAGNIIADVELSTEVKLATVRLTAFDAAEATGAEASVTAFSSSASIPAGQEFVAFDTVESARPELTEAEVVVSGGRAMKSAENFEQYIAPLADALGAAIGASRAAVDSGYAPNDWQVGQTGKVVAPKLYIAIGISGAIQHLAGMKDSKVIVAINTDPDAPIFEVADYGLVADLYEAVPELTEGIKKARA